MQRRDPLRVAGFVSNLVPYHHARWSAFADLGTAECSVIEQTNRDEFPVLEVEARTKRSYQRITLFEDPDKSRLNVREIRALAQEALSKLRPDVVCLGGYATPLSLAAMSWCASARVPMVICSESNEFDEPRQPWREAVKRRLVRLCAAGLAGGTPQAEYLARLGLPSERVFKGYDVVDNRHFEDQAAEARKQQTEIRQKYSLPERYFLASARFTEKKNLPRLLQAHALYRSQSAEREAQGAKRQAQGALPSAPCASRPAPWDLVLLGDGPLRAQLTALRSELGSEHCVHFAGARAYEALPGFYGLANAFVHASTTEQWGLVVNEAMACGLPVLVSNRCGCAPDLVREGQNGFTFDPCDIGALAERMTRISAPEFPLSEFGSASREIISHWTPRTFAENLSQAVEAALGVPSRRANVFDRALLWGLLRG
jgi:1,2-diacylglycerol 3-alpha-glucosyltransferase